MSGPRIWLETILVKPSFAQRSPNQNEWEIKRDFHQEKETEWVGDSDSRRLRERQTEREAEWGNNRLRERQTEREAVREREAVGERGIQRERRTGREADWDGSRLEEWISCSLCHLLLTFLFPLEKNPLRKQDRKGGRPIDLFSLLKEFAIRVCLFKSVDTWTPGHTTKQCLSSVKSSGINVIICFK